MVQRSDSSAHVSVRFSGNSIEDCRRNLEVVKGQTSEAKVLSKAEWALREAIQAKAFQCLVARTKDIGVAYDLSHSVAEKVFAKMVAGAVGSGSENAYVRRAASNATIVHFKREGKRGRLHLEQDKLESADIAGNWVESPEELRLNQEDLAERKSWEQVTQEEYTKLRPEDQHVIRWVDMDEKPIRDLVVEYVRQTLPAAANDNGQAWGLTKEQWTTARNTVDRRIQRARKRLRVAVERRMAG